LKDDESVFLAQDWVLDEVGPQGFLEENFNWDCGPVRHASSTWTLRENYNSELYFFEQVGINLIPALIGLDSEDGIVHIESLRKDETWFFLGDIHGNPECLKWAFRYIQGFKGFRLCLLGDVFDRGNDEADCFEMILWLSSEHPEQVMWLAGNHDRPVGENHTQPSWPPELIDLRNELMPRLPFMALFPEGTIAMHGGPPSASRLGQGHYKKPLITPEIRKLVQQSRFVDFKDCN
jgi:hypothetical protein